MSDTLSDVVKPDALYGMLHALPKVDLHTHLNGSISIPCLQHLAALLLGDDSATAEVFQFTSKGQGNAEMGDRTDDLTTNFTDPVSRMHHCFKVFDAIYKVMNSLAFTRVGIQDILFHYLSENTVYMEMRTSLRTGMYTTFEEHQKAVQNNCAISQNSEFVASKSDYWKTVTNTIAGCLTLHGWSESGSNSLLASHNAHHTSFPFLLPGVVSPWLPFALILPSASILCPVLGSGNDKPKEMCSPYIAALDAWIALYGGKSTSVGLFVLQLRNEAQRIADVLTSSRPSDSLPFVSLVSHPSKDELHLFPHVIAAIARLRIRMLISISRGHSMEENEDTGRLIPEILAEDATHISNYKSNIAGDDKKCERNSTVLPTSAGRENENAVESAFSCIFPLLVGIDLGGSPYKGNLKDILALLQRLRNHFRLPLTIHGGEKKNDEEVEAMISLNPDRWSHLVFLSQKHLHQLQTRKNGITTVELCLTSNLVTNGSDNVSQHHIQDWIECVSTENGSNASSNVNLSEKEKDILRDQDPLSGFHAAFKGTSHVSLHTDDCGVFNTSMTRELWLFSCHTTIFPVETFGEIGSQKRCDNLFPILKAFHSKSTEIIFAPPTSSTATESMNKSYSAELMHHFNTAWKSRHGSKKKTDESGV